MLPLTLVVLQYHSHRVATGLYTEAVRGPESPGRPPERGDRCTPLKNEMVILSVLHEHTVKMGFCCYNNSVLILCDAESQVVRSTLLTTRKTVL